jgi:hypothetical protein
MNLPLFLLHLRRALHPGLWLLLAGTSLLVVLGAPQGAGDVLQSGIDSAVLARGLRRADLGFALLIVLLPTLLVGVARTFRRLDDGERHWLLSRPVSRACIALSSWAGGFAGGLLWLCAVGLGCELHAGGGAASWRAGDELELTEIRRDAGEGTLLWRSQSAQRPPGCLARLTTGLFGSYNEVEAIELGARAASSVTPFATGRAEAGRKTVVEVELPPGGETLLFTLRARGARSQLDLNAPRLELFLPSPERAGTWQLLLRVALLLAGSLALALGLGAWLSPASSLLLLLGGYALAWLESDSLDGTWLARWLPGYDLPVTLALVAEGRGPATTPAEAWLGALALVLLGLAAQRAALGRWRAGP